MSQSQALHIFFWTPGMRVTKKLGFGLRAKLGRAVAGLHTEARGLGDCFKTSKQTATEGGDLFLICCVSLGKGLALSVNRPESIPAYKIGAPGFGFKWPHGSEDSGHFSFSEPSSLPYPFMFCACVCMCVALAHLLWCPCGGQRPTGGR